MLAKAQMFDERGRIVKTIFSNEYLGTEGVFYWDGTTENQAKASIGIYILRFEVFSTSGGVFFVAKKAVTLAGKL
jgi:flagellar hook assembly protein FlgD